MTNLVIDDFLEMVQMGVVDEHLSTFGAAIRARREFLANMRAASLNVGDRVRFIKGDEFAGIEGIVVKKMTKNILVKMDLGDDQFRFAGRRRIINGAKWRVHPNTIEKVEDGDA